MTHYKAIFKDKYEYEFRISPEDNTRFQYLNWKGFLHASRKRDYHEREH